MDSYNVIITDRALEQLESYIDYIQYTLLNVQAADAVSLDAVDTCTKYKRWREVSDSVTIPCCGL